MPEWIEGAGWRFWRGDFREIIHTIPDDFYDIITTDPPYAKETHEGARTDVEHDARAHVDFDYLTTEEMYEHLGMLSRVCRRWMVATMDWRHIAALDAKPPKGWRFVRFGLWVKPSYTPQQSGDRPATGWEGIALLHRDEKGRPRRMRWNGGGKAMIYTDPKPNKPIYPTQKPVGLIRKFVQDFADAGPVRIFEPYAGSGTSVVAGVLERKEVDCCERRPEAWPITFERISNIQAEGTEAIPLVTQRSLF